MKSRIILLLVEFDYLVISLALGLNYSQPRGISLLVSYKASEARRSDLKHHDKDAGDPYASNSKTHY